MGTPMTQSPYSSSRSSTSRYGNKKPAQPSATKRFFRALGVLLLLLAFLAGTVYGWQSWSNHSKVKALQAEIAASMQEGGRNRERSREIRDQVKELPASYQQDFRRGMRDMFQARQEQRMRDYLALDKAARREELLKRIAEDEKRRAEWEKRRKEREAELAKNGGQRDGGQGGQGQGGNGSGGQGGGGPGGGGGGRGLAARLDNSTPQGRAAMAEYVRDMNQVRRELGMPPWHGGRGGRR
jgi:hypothetical protein